MLFNNLVKINLENKNSHLDLFLIDNLYTELPVARTLSVDNIKFISKTHCHLDIPKILSTHLWTCRNSEFDDPLKSINFYMVDHNCLSPCWVVKSRLRCDD